MYSSCEGCPRDQIAQEVEAFIAYLLRDNATLTTGAVYTISGGLTQE
jgi:hypothetical protein